MNALVIALALMGQNGANYDLITEAAPTMHTSKGSYHDPKVTALADARARVRAHSKALAEAQADVRELTRDVNDDEPIPKSRIEYVERVPTARPGPAPVLEEVGVGNSIRSVPVRSTVRTRPAVLTTQAPSTAGSSCYSESYQSAPPTVTYGAPMVMQEVPATAGSSCYSSQYQSAPRAYSSAPPMVIREAPPPVMYMTAAPTFYGAEPMFAAEPAFLGNNVTTSSGRTRMGLFGRVRSNFRQTSVSSGMPMTFGSGGGFFSGAGAVCVGGACR
jgi:hypothetical protein